MSTESVLPPFLADKLRLAREAAAKIALRRLEDEAEAILDALGPEAFASIREGLRAPRRGGLTVEARREPEICREDAAKPSNRVP